MVLQETRHGTVSTLSSGITSTAIPAGKTEEVDTLPRGTLRALQKESAQLPFAAEVERYLLEGLTFTEATTGRVLIMA